MIKKTASDKMEGLVIVKKSTRSISNRLQFASVIGPYATCPVTMILSLKEFRVSTFDFSSVFLRISSRITFKGP